jgi:hypothetical protein
MDDGWDGRVYLVNGGEAVFKFPRSPETKMQYQRAVRVLDAVQTIDSPILIPLLEWRGPDLQWLGYKHACSPNRISRRPSPLSATSL